MGVRQGDVGRSVRALRAGFGAGLVGGGWNDSQGCRDRTRIVLALGLSGCILRRAEVSDPRTEDRDMSDFERCHSTGGVN